MNYKIKKNEIIYFIGLFFLCLINWDYFSKLIEFDSILKNFLILTTALCFVFYIFSSKYTKKELLITIAIAFIFFISGIKTKEFYLFINIFAILSSKNISSKKIIKFMFFSNLFFLILHAITTGLGVLANSKVYYTYLDGTTRQTLNLRHPNFLAAIMFWTLAAFTYITKNKSKIMKLTITLLCAIITYMLTYSRTSMILFVLLFFVILFNNSKLINFAEKKIKVCILILIIIEIIIGFKYFTLNGEIKSILVEINELLSQRLYLNALALESFNLTLLGNQVIQLSNEVIIIDSFYISCLIQYGITILIIYIYALIKYEIKNNCYKFMLIILVFIACLTERYTIFISLSFPLFFLKELIFKSKNNIKK